MNRYAKAIIAALTAGFAVYQLSTSSTSALGDVVSQSEWIHIAVSTLVSGLGT